MIAADVGGLPEIVAEGVTGYIVPSENPDVLAATLDRLLTERERAVRMGATGKVRAAANFPFERHVDEHEQLYQTITGNSQSADNAI